MVKMEERRAQVFAGRKGTQPRFSRCDFLLNISCYLQSPALPSVYCTSMIVGVFNHRYYEAESYPVLFPDCYRMATLSDVFEVV